MRTRTPSTVSLLSLLVMLALVLPVRTSLSNAEQEPLVVSSSVSASTQDQSADDFASNPVMFIENAGQWDDDARFQVWGGPGGTTWLADDSIWVTMVESGSEDQWSEGQRSEQGIDSLADLRYAPSDEPRRGVAIKLSFVGANPQSRIETYDRLDTVVSYFRGDDPTEWQPDVPVWGGVRYVDLYPGVDLELDNENAQMMPRLVVRPNADVGMVRLRVEGANAVAVEGDVLRLSTAVGEVTWPLLRVDEIQLAGSPEARRLADPQVEAVGEQVFDVAAPFVLADSNLRSLVETRKSPADNPVDLFYSTFLGGREADFGTAIALDEADNAFVMGSTQSGNFPITPGVFDPSYAGVRDAFAAKLNPDGSRLVYATFLGGSSNDYGNAITVDESGSAYAAGGTISSDFPTTPGAFDTNYNGGDCGGVQCTDGFIVKLNPAGSELTYATFLGGSSGDDGAAIAVDETGSAYVTGGTSSSDFPTTPDALDESYNGAGDAFVAKLNPSGSGLAYGSFLGGTGGDDGRAIAVDETTSAYVTGATRSYNFPTTPGSFDPNLSGTGDAYVAKLNLSGSGLAYATFLGGSDSDHGEAIALDDAGSAFIVGITASSNFPTTPAAFDRSYNNHTDAFIAKLNPAGSGLTYATFLGGSDTDYGEAIAVDSAGSAYIAGITASSNLPTTTSAFDRSYNDGGDAFVAKLNPAGSALTYATFLGGSFYDEGRAIAVDGAGRAYVGSYTDSYNFPTTPGAFDPSHNGGYYEAFAAKLAAGGDTSPTPTPTRTPTRTPTATPTSTPTPTATPTVFVQKSYLPLLLQGLRVDPCQRYEPNNSLATARGPLENGETIESALCNGDPDDYYFVDLAATTTLVLDLTHLPAGTDYDLFLYSTTGGSPIAQSRNTGTTSERISISLGAGRYFVRVYPYTGRSSQPYLLSASWSASAQAEFPAPQPSDKLPAPLP